MKLALHFVLCALCASVLTARAGITPDKLPTLLGTSNAGTEFYFSFPPCYEEESAGGDKRSKVVYLLIMNYQP